MLPPDTLGEIDNYWMGHLGCPPNELFEADVVVLPHSTFKGYQGLFLVRRGRHCIVSAPAEIIHLIHTLIHERDAVEVFGSGLWRQQLPDLLDAVVGPASVTYCDASNHHPHPIPGTTLLGPEDRDSVARLHEACDDREWDRANLLPGHLGLHGHWLGGQLVAVAGYEMWGERIAHIGVITHPAHRGEGYGKAVVSAVVQHAIDEGLIAQFRTLIANTPAMALARSLGFEEYAQTLAVGLNVPRLLEYMNPQTGDEPEQEDTDPADEDE